VHVQSKQAVDCSSRTKYRIAGHLHRYLACVLHISTQHMQLISLIAVQVVLATISSKQLRKHSCLQGWETTICKACWFFSKFEPTDYYITYNYCTCKATLWTSEFDDLSDRREKLILRNKKKQTDLNFATELAFTYTMPIHYLPSEKQKISKAEFLEFWKSKITHLLGFLKAKNLESQISNPIQPYCGYI
jgi:hypothetical protein